MPYDPDPRPYVSQQLHHDCSWAYYERYRHLSAPEISLLLRIMQAYSNHSRITRTQRDQAIQVVSRVLNLS